MSTILKFILNTPSKALDVHFTSTTSQQNNIISLSFEYLRIFSPSELSKTKANNDGSPLIPEVFHKKNVTIIAIESVGKHGYRIIFDDNHQDIFSSEELLHLSVQFEQYWPLYIKSLSTTHSREASINFKSVT